MSLLRSLDAEEHLKIGSALRPLLLQDDNILVVGSGQVKIFWSSVEASDNEAPYAHVLLLIEAVREKYLETIPKQKYFKQIHQIRRGNS